jgi:GxGYxYP putative glycoside hydrolase C-terminal domain
VAPNLTSLSSIRDTGITQQPAPKPVTRKKHHVTFVISDGDNIAYNLWSMNEYLRGPGRGSFDVGYGITPSTVDLAPGPLRWYFDNALPNEDFIAGPSGQGYTFPSRMPPADLDRYVRRLNDYLGKADLGITEILEDQEVFGRTDLWSKYLRQPNVDALFYFGPGSTGQIDRVQGKPVVAQRDVLWQGLTEEAELTERINDRPADPTSADGYTLVLVHVWTKNLMNIKTVVDGLDPDVEVVTPREFVGLINQNKVG